MDKQLYGLFYGHNELFAASFNKDLLLTKQNDLSILSERASAFNQDQAKRAADINSHYLYEIHATNDPYTEKVLRGEWHEKSQQYSKIDNNHVYQNLTIKEIQLI